MRQKLIETQSTYDQQQRPLCFKYITRGWDFVGFLLFVYLYMQTEDRIFVYRLHVTIRCCIQFVEGMRNKRKRYE